MTQKGTLVRDPCGFAMAKKNEGCFRRHMFLAEGQVLIFSLFYIEFLFGVGMMARSFGKEKETDRRSLPSFPFFPRELFEVHSTTQ